MSRSSSILRTGKELKFPHPSGQYPLVWTLLQTHPTNFRPNNKPVLEGFGHTNLLSLLAVKTKKNKSGKGELSNGKSKPKIKERATDIAKDDDYAFMFLKLLQKKILKIKYKTSCYIKITSFPQVIYILSKVI